MMFGERDGQFYELLPEIILNLQEVDQHASGLWRITHSIV